MARKRKQLGWGWRILALLALVAAGAGLYIWWEVQHWTPPEDAYPDQGIFISAENGLVNFNTLAALGGSFAYLQASSGTEGKDDRFARNLTAAQDAGLQAGAVHMFDPCVLADGQSANFVTMVPRGGDFLPPVIALHDLADSCEKRVSDAAVESELMTLINQIENHTGKPVILKITPEFEAAYNMSGKLERNLWVNRTRFAPTYAKRPWLLWSANEELESAAAELPVEWVVVQP